ncbi:MAG: pilQ [Firmicutes bacterium]|nr:pilQ [Bacillota bacterium]
MNSCFKRWKKIICAACIAGLLSIGATAFAYGYSPMVSMSVVDADVRDVLTGLASIGRVNVVIDDAVTGRISVDFNNIPFDSALEIITKTKGLSLYRTGNVLVFSSQEKMEKGFSQANVFTLKYARADHIKNIIVGGGKSDSEFAVENPGATSGTDAGTLKTTAGGATASSANSSGIKGLVINTDASTNSIIAYGAPEQIEKVRQLLKELDVPYQQILLEAQVINLSKSASKELGIDWTWGTVSQTQPESSSSSSSTTVASLPIAVFTAGDGKQYTFGLSGVTAKINALITNGDAKILARPNVMTFNGNKATIFIGDQLPIVTPTTTNGTTTNTTTYKNAGITLAYVPRINEDENITASVFVEVSIPSKVVISGTTAYEIKTRSAQTNVRMKDGATLVIGGLISTSDIKGVNKVPFLGDLPILGKLFQSVTSTKDETEVVIFLKAKIVK